MKVEFEIKKGEMQSNEVKFLNHKKIIFDEFEAKIKNLSFFMAGQPTSDTPMVYWDKINGHSLDVIGHSEGYFKCSPAEKDYKITATLL